MQKRCSSWTTQSCLWHFTRIYPVSPAAALPFSPSQGLSGRDREGMMGFISNKLRRWWSFATWGATFKKPWWQPTDCDVFVFRTCKIYAKQLQAYTSSNQKVFRKNPLLKTPHIFPHHSHELRNRPTSTPKSRSCCFFFKSSWYAQWLELHSTHQHPPQWRYCAPWGWNVSCWIPSDFDSLDSLDGKLW